METDVFSWLHLTDFHFGIKGQKFLWPTLRDSFLHDLEGLRQRTGPWQAVLFTGDLVQQGMSVEFQEMQREVLDRLWEKLQELDSGDAVLLAVPGNHDLFRPDEADDNPALEWLLARNGFSRIAPKFWDNPGGAYRRVVDNAFAAYSQWWKEDPRRPAGVEDGILPGDFAYTLECGGRRIGIVGLNTTFLQLKRGNYKGKLHWDARQLHAVCRGAVDDWLSEHHVCFLLTHQGPDWLAAKARTHGESEIAPAGRFVAHMYGHMHEMHLDYVRKIGGGNAIRHCQGCAAFGMETFGDPPKARRNHGYAAGQIKFGQESATLRLWPRIAISTTGPWRLVPDYQRGHLQEDQGTPPETIAVRPLAVPLGNPRRATAATTAPYTAREVMDLRFSDPAVPKEQFVQEVTECLTDLLRMMPRLLRTMEGSVILRYEFPPDSVPRIMNLVNEGTLSALGLIETRRVSGLSLPPRQPFFGRQKELAVVAKALQPEQVGWGIVIDGAGGVGKTALAVEAAHRAPVEHYPLRLFLTAKGRQITPEGDREFQDHRVDDYNSLLTDIGLILGRKDVARTAPGQRPDAVRDALAEHRVLLVLDNIESFTPTERRQLYDLLDMLPRSCRAIVTTRRRDETAARTLRLDALDAETANQLLESLGKKWPPVAQLTAEDRHRLYAETDGNPLLLVWTASQLGRARGRCRSVEEVVQRLQEAHRLQKANEKNDPLEFIFGDLLDTFTEDETAVLAALAHFTEAARVAWLLPLAELSETAALTALDSLRDRSLVIEDDAHSAWLLPPLTARFLRQRRPEAVGAAGERLTGKAYALAVQYGYGSSAPFAELEAAWPIVQAALPLVIADDNVRLQMVCSAMWRFLNFTGRWDELLFLNERAEAKALLSGDYGNAGLRAYHLGFVRLLRGEADAVFVCADRCTQHWQRAGAGARQRGLVLHLRGLGHHLRENYPAAIAAFQEALELWRSLSPESPDVATGLSALASAKCQSGDVDGAEADYAEALRIARTAGDHEGVAAYTGKLGEVFLARQDWPAAERQAREALKLAQDVNRQELIAWDHHCLAQAMLHQQQAAQALPHAQVAVSVFTRLHSSHLAKAKVTLAACEAALGSK